MSEEFLEPTGQGKRNLLLAFAVLAIGLLIVQAWAMPTFFDYVNALQQCDRISVLEKTAIALLLFPAVTAGAWGLARARKLIRLEQFPLPGDWVIRRTPIRRGRAVRRKGYALLVLSFALFALPFGGLYFFDSVFMSLKERLQCAHDMPTSAASLRQWPPYRLDDRTRACRVFGTG